MPGAFFKQTISIVGLKLFVKGVFFEIVADIIVYALFAGSFEQIDIKYVCFSIFMHSMHMPAHLL